MYGTCQSADTCTSNGGTADGNCASGFGVCCMLTTSSCGSTITQNLTYIQNPSYPSSYGTVGTCTYSFTSNAAICQIRLDFDNFVINNPDATGLCAIDQFTTNARTPTICGMNGGQHMYLETNRDDTPETATFTVGTLGAGITQTRTWKIRVTYIECISNYRAPADCLQYFRGVNGAFKSFNFQTATPQVLQSQNYNICIRQAEGFCRINYSVNDDPTAAVVAPFKTDAGGAATQIAKRICNTGSTFWITIPTTVSAAPSNTEQYCGGKFNTIATSQFNGVVTGTVTPFRVGVFGLAGALTPSAPGFNLMYSQIPC